MNGNPLIDLGALPDFAALRPEHVGPGIDHLLAAAEAALEHAVSPAVAAEYDALSAALDVAVEALDSAWRVVVHLQSVADTAPLRAAYVAALPRVTDFHTRLGADLRLYTKYKAVAAATTLAPPRRRALDHALRDFVLGGAELVGERRERFAAVQARMAELSQQFGEHVMDATDAFALYVDEERLVGVPQAVRQAARAAAEAEGRAGLKLTLQAPCLIPLLQFADDRALRETLYRAHHTRASEFGPAELDNSALMRELLALRAEHARLLGHVDYGTVSLVPKMAESPARVITFVRDLAARARPQAERELAELRAFATRELGLDDLQSWDRAWASEKLRQRRYDFSGAEVQRYFTEPRVLQGLFDLAERLFELRIVPAEAPVWHDSVRFFRIERDGRPLAAFYLDLHARAGKQPGAWMDHVHQRWLRPDGRGQQLPLALLVCNFAAPAPGQPAQLTHDDLITLFHEFGHGLHHMLTRIDDLPVAGIAGVEWDAVELPSQFMENLCWEWDVLRGLSAHVETGEPLPRALFDRMVAARHFHNAQHVLRNCEYALFDMRLHTEPDAPDAVQRIADEVHAELAVLRGPPWVRYPHAFNHLFDGSYAAGYYSYVWAEVLSADAWSAFEEAGLFDRDTGRRFREQILETGGSRDAMENFTAFRGREPRIDAWLRHQGIAGS